MLEIILLIWLSRKLATMAEQKGHSRSYAALGPVFWIGGEVIGFVIGFAMGMDIGALLPALVLASLGAFVAYRIVDNLEPKEHALGGDYPYGYAPAPAIGTFDMDNPYSPPGTYQPWPAAQPPAALAPPAARVPPAAPVAAVAERRSAEPLIRDPYDDRLDRELAALDDDR